MKTLNRYIFKSYLPPFAMTFVISVFILFMQFLWKWVDELVGKGLDWSVTSELFFFASLAMVPLALPMAVLLSSLMTFGNLAEHYELAAMKSAGLSLTRIMRPIFFFTCMVTIGAFFFSNYLLPYSNLKMMSTLFDIHQQKPALNIKEGVFYNEITGYSIRIKKIEEDGQMLKDIMIYNHSDQAGNTELTVAEYGKMEMTSDKRFLVIELHNGETYKEIWDQENANITKPFMRVKFKDQVARLDLSGFTMTRTNPELFKENDKMLNGEQLLAYIDTMRLDILEDRQEFYQSLKNAYLVKSKTYWHSVDTSELKIKSGNILTELDGTEKARAYDLALNNARNCKTAIESKVNEIDAQENSIIRYKIEYWRKYSLSFACLLMFFVGAPLGALIRKGGLGMPVVISIFFFLIYWVLSIVGEKLCKEGSVPVEFGMWLACLFFVPLGFWLTKKATADKGMFDTGSFGFLLFWNFFKRGRKHWFVQTIEHIGNEEDKEAQKDDEENDKLTRS